MRGIGTLRARPGRLQGRIVRDGQYRIPTLRPPEPPYAQIGYGSSHPVSARIFHSARSLSISSTALRLRDWESGNELDVPSIPECSPFLLTRTTSEARILSFRDIMGILDHRPDTASLLDLISDLDDSIYDLPVTQASEIISALLREMGKLSVLAPVPEVLRTFVDRVNQGIQDDEPEARTSEQLERLYTPVVRSIGWFHRQSTLVHPNADTRLNRYTDHLLVRLVENMINQIELLPTTSQSPSPTLSHETLGLLFSKPFLQPELRKLLLGYTRTRNMTMSSWMWWRCYLSAVDQGDLKAAKRFRYLSGQRAKVESKAKIESLPLTSEIGKEQERKDTAGVDQRGIAEVTSARTSRRVQEVLDLVGSRLYDTNSQTSHVWSQLFNTTRKDSTIKPSTLSSLRHSIPKDEITTHTLTPLMLSCLEKGDPTQAWQIWRDLIERHSTDGKSAVDRIALAVSTLVVYTLSDLDASIRLLDSWAKRPSTTSSPIGHKHKNPNSTQSIVLDTQNVNIILRHCMRERRPSVALRVFTAALPRWGVYTDDISLTLLLDTCRFHDPNRSRGGKSRHGDAEDIPNVRDRLRQLTDSIRFGRTRSETPISTTSPTQMEGYEAYDAVGFAKGSISVLLEPPGYLWRKEHSEPAWSKARDIFRDVLFTNYPFLADVPSVLDFERGPYAHQARDLSSIFRFGSKAPQTNQPLTSTSTSTSPFNSNSRSKSTKSRIPSSDSRRPYLHLVPSANTFHSAIALLGYHNLPQEIPLVLAWMKEIDIKPDKRTMILALTHLGEVEGPRRVLADWQDGQSRLVRDTEVLRRWLIDWVGRGVPTEDDVADHRRKMLENNVRLSA